MLQLSGSITALATPFQSGRFDEAAYKRLIDYQLAEGTSALVPMGTTGESATTSRDERLAAIRLCVQHTRGRVPVIAGVGTHSTEETLSLTGAARDAGADGALVVTPYYNKPTQAGLVAHFKAIAAAHPGFPLVAYNVPGRTGVDLLPDTALRLCEVREVIALKEATGLAARALDIVELCKERLTLLSGDDFTVAPFLACGGKGVISVSSNVAPRLMADLVRAGVERRVDDALALQLKLQPLHRLLFCEPNPIPVKWALHAMGFFTSDIRLPLLPMSREAAVKLEAELARLGLLEKGLQQWSKNP